MLLISLLVITQVKLFTGQSHQPQQSAQLSYLQVSIYAFLHSCSALDYLQKSYLTRVSWRLNERTHEKHLERSVTYREQSIVTAFDGTQNGTDSLTHPRQVFYTQLHTSSAFVFFFCFCLFVWDVFPTYSGWHKLFILLSLPPSAGIIGTCHQLQLKEILLSFKIQLNITSSLKLTT